MKNKIKISILISTLISLNTLNAGILDNIKEENVDYHTNIKFGYLNNTKNVNTTADVYTSYALSGNTGFNYKINNKFIFSTSLYFGKNLNNTFEINNNNKLPAFYENIMGSDDFVYFGELYLSYQPNNDTNIMVGYQSFDLPYFNSFDNRLTKNSFETIVGEYIGLDNFYFVGGYINKMAGKDLIKNQNISSKYGYMYGNTIEQIGQTAFVGSLYKYNENNNIGFYFFNINKIANVVYGEYKNIHNYIKNINTKVFIQGSNISENNFSNYEGTVYGTKLSLNYKKYNINLAYNISNVNIGKSIAISKGISPYYTTNDNISIEDINEDSQSFKIYTQYEIDKKWNIDFSYSSYVADTSTNYDKVSTDLKVNYKYNQHLSANLTFTNLKDNNIKNNSENIIFSKISYEF